RCVHSSGRDRHRARFLLPRSGCRNLCWTLGFVSLTVAPVQRLLAVLIAATGLLLSGCASERESELAQSVGGSGIASRGEARDFLRELQKNDFNSRTGAGSDERTDIFARYDDLFSETNIELVQRVEDSFEPGPDERKFRRLRLFLIESRIRA